MVLTAAAVDDISELCMQKAQVACPRQSHMEAPPTLPVNLTNPSCPPLRDTTLKRTREGGFQF